MSSIFLQSAATTKNNYTAQFTTADSAVGSRSGDILPSICLNLPTILAITYKLLVFLYPTRLHSLMEIMINLSKHDD